MPSIQKEVEVWQKKSYKGATETTLELLNYWFKNDHILANGKPFQFHKAQKEAIETLIYVYEVKKVRTRANLIQNYALNVSGLRLPPYDNFARYCINMANRKCKNICNGNGYSLAVCQLLTRKFRLFQ